MPMFNMGADAEKWMKCPPDTIHAGGHTGPWMGHVEKKLKHPTKMWKGEPDLDWHVRMSDGSKKVINTKTARQHRDVAVTPDTSHWPLAPMSSFASIAIKSRVTRLFHETCRFFTWAPTPRNG